MLWSFGTFFGRNTARQKRERLAARRLEAIRRRFASLKAKYDAAQTTAENKRQWALADGLSARSANSLMVRKILRERSRYESCNNSYAAGMLLTLANDMVGTGPRLQLDLPNRGWPRLDVLVITHISTNRGGRLSSVGFRGCLLNDGGCVESRTDEAGSASRLLQRRQAPGTGG